MNTPKQVINLYLTLVLTNTLATSFIWGIDTLFLLDAGLTNLQVFTVNAFFLVGQLLFEIPTGIVADAKGRRTSYLWGSLTLAIATTIYLLAWNFRAPFGFFILSSTLLGLGYTFYSGATEAWLVDALKHTKHNGELEEVFGKGQTIGGIAMLTGAVAGGLIAQFSSIAIPYILRSSILVLNLGIAYFFMKDIGFKPKKEKNALTQMKSILGTSIEQGLRKPKLRWLMISSLFTTSVGFYAFYAMQPYLLELFGNKGAYGIAGLAAAIIAGTNIFGGMLVKIVNKLFTSKTTFFALGIIASSVTILFFGITNNFYIALVLIILWSLLGAVIFPIRRAYLNKRIPSEQRATVLSFDSLIGSSGGIVIQPTLGRFADMYSYSISLMLASAINFLALPFILLAKKKKKD